MSQYTYKFTFKKGDIFFEYSTTDKDSLARQFQIWVTNASIYSYNKEKMQEIKPKDIEKIVRVNPELIVENHSPQMSEEELSTKKNEIADVVEHAHEIGNHIDELYSEKTINTLQGLKEDIVEEKIEQEFTQLNDNFDEILNQSLNTSTFEPENKKDDRFLKILNVKNVTENIEYLIVTAYYLSEFEKMDKFTLKLINAKLMQNVEKAVDHSVLQEAIDRNLVEALPNLPQMEGSAEYRLTNLGEEAFLNGTSLQ